MDKKQLRQKIKELGPWYQNITLGGIKTLRKRDTEAAWKRINENFPFSERTKFRISYFYSVDPGSGSA